MRLVLVIEGRPLAGNIPLRERRASGDDDERQNQNAGSHRGRLL
jgi:hypothetical protein